MHPEGPRGPYARPPPPGSRRPPGEWPRGEREGEGGLGPGRLGGPPVPLARRGAEALARTPRVQDGRDPPLPDMLANEGSCWPRREARGFPSRYSFTIGV